MKVHLVVALFLSGVSMAQAALIGPSGPYTGDPKYAYCRGSETLTQIFVVSGSWIDKIGVKCKSGTRTTTRSMGGNGGTRTDTIRLYGGDRVNYIWGNYTLYIDAIGFQIRRRNGTYDFYTFGGTGGETYFYYPMSRIVEPFNGFFGNAAKYVDAVGIVTKP